MLFIKIKQKNNNFMNILTTSRLFTFVREGTMYEISTACFIYRSIFAVQALRKRRVQGHCAAYHFRIVNIEVLFLSFMPFNCNTMICSLKIISRCLYSIG